MRFSVGVKISLLMIMAIIIVIATGYLSYRSLSSIVNSIDIETRPDLKLEHIREISTELEKAENRLRLYMLTSNERALKSYFSIIHSVDVMIDTLKSESSNDTKLVNQIDTLHSLINQKKRVWRDMLLLENNDEINAQYAEIEEILNETITDTIEVQPLKEEKDTFKIVTKAIETEDTRNFFQKLFKKKKTETVKTPEITMENKQESEIIEIPEPEIMEIETQVNKEEIQEKLKKLKELDNRKQTQLKEKELQLAHTSNEITLRFYRLVENIEKDEFMKSKGRIEKADNLANETYKWLALFAISGTLLAVSVIIILFRYTRKSIAYQKALEQSKAEAEKLAKTREIFMANVSHEIRTPLNAISGFTDNLIKNSKDPETSSELNIIKSASDQLLRMMNDLLDFSKLQSDKVKLEYSYFSLKKIFEEVYNLFRYQAKEQKIMFFYHIDEEIPDVLYGDRYRLKQILINLINNSLKFTKEGQVSFTAENYRQFGNNLELKIVVKDTGIGIEKNKLSVIFDEFIQADASYSRKFGGTGLGLSIVKKLLDLHKGKIEVTSNVGTGTSITFLIPYEIGDESKIVFESNNDINIPVKLKGKRILIVDDTEYNRLLLKKLLINYSFKVEEASSGYKAIELVKRKKYDLILLDIRMPDLDGYKVAKFIRNSLRAPLSDVPIITISAAFNEDNIEKGEKAGINKFITKPFSQELLMKSIVEIFGFEFKEPLAVKTETLIDSKKGKLNFKDLYRISGNQQGFVTEMLEKFIDVTEKGVKDIEKELFNNNKKQIIEIAHKLAPPCRHIGAINLYNLFKAIENNTEKEDLSSLVKESVKEFNLIKSEIKYYLAKTTSKY